MIQGTNVLHDYARNSLCPKVLQYIITVDQTVSDNQAFACCILVQLYRECEALL